jgi:hypothetical protein
MKAPPNSPDMEAVIDNLHSRYGSLEANLLQEIDSLAKAGVSDKRWCAIARTHVEEAFKAMHRAKRDYPGQNPNEYGKIQAPTPMPADFDPPVDPEGRRQVASQGKIEWKDYGPGEALDPPDRPDKPLE